MASDECVIETLKAEISRLRQYIDAMNGNGNVRHVYCGNCPDELQPDALDETCPACRLLLNLGDGGYPK